MAPPTTAPPFGHGAPQSAPGPNFNNQPAQGDPNRAASATGGQPSSSANLVAQEVNGMVYYYDASQIAPQVPDYPAYAGPQGYMPGVVGMGGMVAPSPEASFYYQQAPPGMVYYGQ